MSTKLIGRYSTIILISESQLSQDEFVAALQKAGLPGFSRVNLSVSGFPAGLYKHTAGLEHPEGLPQYHWSRAERRLAQEFSQGPVVLEKYRAWSGVAKALASGKLPKSASVSKPSELVAAAGSSLGSSVEDPVAEPVSTQQSTLLALLTESRDILKQQSTLLALLTESRDILKQLSARLSELTSSAAPVSASVAPELAEAESGQKKCVSSVSHYRTQLTALAREGKGFGAFYRANNLYRLPASDRDSLRAFYAALLKEHGFRPRRSPKKGPGVA